MAVDDLTASKANYSMMLYTVSSIEDRIPNGCRCSTGQIRLSCQLRPSPNVLVLSAAINACGQGQRVGPQG